MRVGDGFILAFDVTSRWSFDELAVLVDHVVRTKDANLGDVPFVVVANKCDLENARAVSAAEARDFAASIGAAFIETSARWRTNVDETFAQAVREVRHRNPRPAGKRRGASVAVTKDKMSLKQKLRLAFGGMRR